MIFFKIYILETSQGLKVRLIENKVLRSFDDEKFEYFYILLGILIIFEINIFFKLQFAIFIFNHFKSQSRLVKVYGQRYITDIPFFKLMLKGDFTFPKISSYLIKRIEYIYRHILIHISCQSSR